MIIIDKKQPIMQLYLPMLAIKGFFWSFLVYYLQGMLYPSGSIISQGSLLIFLLISLYYTMKVVSLKRVGFFASCLLIFVTLEVCYALLSDNYHLTSSGTAITNMSRLKLILMSLLAFFPCYYWTLQGVLVEKHVKVFFLVCFVLMSVRFFYVASQTRLALDREEITNNSAYFLVHLLPFIVLFNQKRVLSFVMLAFAFFLIVLGAKRGAFVIATCVVLIYVWYMFKLLHTRRAKMKLLLFLIAGIAIAFYFSLDTLLESSQMFERLSELEEGGTSGRNMLYFGIWEHWLNCNSLFHYFLGFGFNSSVDIVGNLAHNDWLELLSTSGLLGVCTYLLVFYALWRVRGNKLLTIHERTICIMIFVIWFCLTVFSMGYTDVVLEMMLLGFVLGDVRTRELDSYDIVGDNENIVVYR